MGKKFKLFSGDSFLLSLKVIGTGILMSIPAWFFNMIKTKFQVGGMFLMVMWFVFTLFLFGYVLNRIFKVK